MTSEEPISTASPEERATELARLFRNLDGTNTVSYSAEESGAIVTCYVHVDQAPEVESLAADSGFDVVHSHGSGDEVHYTFGYSAEDE